MLQPAASVLHYGQAVFEGMKAFKDDMHDVFPITSLYTTVLNVTKIMSYNYVVQSFKKTNRTWNRRSNAPSFSIF